MVNAIKRSLTPPRSCFWVISLKTHILFPLKQFCHATTLEEPFFSSLYLASTMRITSIASLALVGCALAAPPQPQFEGLGGETPSPTPTSLPVPSGSAPPPFPPPPGPPGPGESSLPFAVYGARAPPYAEGGEGLPTPSGGPYPTGFPGSGIPLPVPTSSVPVDAVKRQFEGAPAFGGEGEGQGPPPAPTPSVPGFPFGPGGIPSGATPTPSGTPSGIPSGFPFQA